MDETIWDRVRIEACCEGYQPDGEGELNKHPPILKQEALTMTLIM